MSKFSGDGPRTGAIGICAQCRNKSEVALYPNDNPDPICEACYRDNCKLEAKIEEKAAENQVQDLDFRATRPTSFQSELSSAERDTYLNIIRERADDKWVKSFIKETLAKNVLLYDWKHVIGFDRWFSVLDLRRFALEVDPNFERPRAVSDADVDSLMGPVKVKKTRKKRATQQGALENA